MRDAASNPWTTIDQRHPRPGRRNLFAKQGKMGAGEDDDVDRLALGQRAHRRQSVGDRGGVDRRPGELGFGQPDQLGAAVADDDAVGGKALGKVIDIGLADGRGGAKHPDHARFAQRRGGADGGNGADDGDIERGADLVERDRRGGVACDHDEAGMESLDEASKQGGDSRAKLGFALRTVWETGIVCGVDNRRGGQERASRGQHRQSPDPRIEQQDGVIEGHSWVLALRFVRRNPSLQAQAKQSSGGRWIAALHSQRRVSLVADRSHYATHLAMTGTLILVLAISYLIGSIPFGLILTRVAGKGDIRAIGSGNIGATNVLRTGSKGLAALTLLLDAAKGALVVYIAQRWSPQFELHAAAAVLIGHLYPLWLRFRGGKGVATLLGILIALLPIAALIYALMWLGVLLLVRISSVAGMIAATCAPVTAAVLGDVQRFPLLLGLAVLVLWQHRGNIVRLLAGEEPRVGQSVT